MTRDNEIQMLSQLLETRRKAILETSRVTREELDALQSQDRDAEHEENAQTEQADFTLSHLMETQRRELLLIDAAQARINAGTFGECIDCGAEIPTERLTAIPYTLRCEDDAEQYEHDHIGGSSAFPTM
jgi:DnaK suppressor protein